MIYSRAAASDFDDWMRLGNPGWGAADLIPLARKVRQFTYFLHAWLADLNAVKLETYQAEGNGNATHGSSGPIKVSYGGYQMKAGVDFLAAAAEFPRGRSFTDDPNDFKTCDVMGLVLSGSHYY